MQTKPSWGVIISKGVAADAALISWWILFSRYTFVLEIPWSYAAMLTSLLVFMVLAVLVLCLVSTRKWGFSFLISVVTFCLFNLFMSFIPNSASVLYSSSELTFSTRLTSDMIFRYLLIGHILLPVIMVYIRLSERDRQLNTCVDSAPSDSIGIQMGKTAAITFILMTVLIIKSYDIGILHGLLIACGTWSMPIAVFAAGILSVPILCIRGTRFWQRCIISAAGLVLVIWLFPTIVCYPYQITPGFEFVKTFFFLSAVNLVVSFVLFTSLIMLVLRKSERKRLLHDGNPDPC